MIYVNKTFYAVAKEEEFNHYDRILQLVLTHFDADYVRAIDDDGALKVGNAFHRTVRRGQEESLDCLPKRMLRKPLLSLMPVSFSTQKQKERQSVLKCRFGQLLYVINARLPMGWYPGVCAAMNKVESILGKGNCTIALPEMHMLCKCKWISGLCVAVITRVLLRRDLSMDCGAKKNTGGTIERATGVKLEKGSIRVGCGALLFARHIACNSDKPVYCVVHYLHDPTVASEKPFESWAADYEMML